MRKIYGYGLAMLVLLIGTIAMAQPGVVMGTATDTTGAGIDSVYITLRVGCMGPILYSTYTGTNGSYVLSAVDPDDYRIKAQKQGYGMAMQNITVLAGETLVVNFVLSGGCGGGGGCNPDSCTMGPCDPDSCTQGGCGGCGDGVPARPKISKAYPNPFNPSTSISFNLPQSAQVNLSVWNLNGQRVALLTNSQMEAGVHRMTWNAENLASGIYLVRLEAANSVSIKRVVFTK
jgi:hypothetical protein